MQRARAGMAASLLGSCGTRGGGVGGVEAPDSSETGPCWARTRAARRPGTRACAQCRCCDLARLLPRHQVGPPALLAPPSLPLTLTGGPGPWWQEAHRCPPITKLGASRDAADPPSGHDSAVTAVGRPLLRVLDGLNAQLVAFVGPSDLFSETLCGWRVGLCPRRASVVSSGGRGTKGASPQGRPRAQPLR